jgi:hypothetical protein
LRFCSQRARHGRYQDDEHDQSERALHGFPSALATRDGGINLTGRRIGTGLA